jgi:hypothetical protein
MIITRNASGGPKMQQNQPGSTLVERLASFIPSKPAKYVFTPIVKPHPEYRDVVGSTEQDKTRRFLLLI